ncbi:crustacean hyperglycemic hormone 6-like [Penaeus monodon]|uniref:Crustacean hyperglycemic hormone protein n=1 Tax=Penaeus monodon TaxID=6687 RepID=A0A2Z4N404_PENMO|nr:crustacean hyperglycemic hormone 6-like [Penaeus monodon]AWX63581.1 crustacean hyperglycemic hormone protein [Penaeus monodon]
MDNKIALVSASILLLVAVLASHSGVHARSVVPEGLQDLEIPRQESVLFAVRRKRQVFDASCKGIYDRALWAKLNNVCLDCQNIYRGNPAIEGECRENCFGTQVFYGCVKALKLPTKNYLYYADLLRES